MAWSAFVARAREKVRARATSPASTFPSSATSGALHHVRAALATLREEGLSNDTVVVGPPLSGVTSLAKSLAGQYSYLLIEIDTMIAEAACVNNLQKRGVFSNNPAPRSSNQSDDCQVT